MKIAITTIAIVFSLADAFMMWCLMRANALYERAEPGLVGVNGNGDKRREQNDETEA